MSTTQAKREFSALSDPPSLPNLVVVLVSARNPLNIGAVARAMSNFGCAQLRLVAVHPPSVAEVKSAVGPAQQLLQSAQTFETLAEAISDCGLVYGTLAPYGRLPDQPMLPLPSAAHRVHSAMQTGKVAMLFGSEKTGLSNHDFSHCHGVVGIPVREQHASMNLGQATAVCLYAIAQAAATAQPDEKPDPALAAAEHIDRITALLGQALAAANYVGIGRPWADDNLRALVRRMRIPEQDASALTGMLRKIVWVLENRRDASP